MVGWRARGWAKFGPDAATRAWAEAALPVALAAIGDPANAQWHRAGGTWFVGVNALPNGPDGALPGGPPLAGPAIDMARRLAGGAVAWDRAQVSRVLPGYPVQDGEPDTAFRFRLKRDAAHVDGLHRVGEGGRRFLREPHAFILGLPLTETGPGASPLVVWEGSHRIMAEALSSPLAGLPPERWPDVDLTEAYHAARRRAFETCRRVEVHAQPGEAYLVHRLTLHGISPWREGAAAPPEGRIIAYFRPPLGGIETWPAI